MSVKEILSSGALVLSIVNGVALFKFYRRDRARISVEPVHPDVYQWWFRLPDGQRDCKPTRKYGFLTYLGIGNSGLRKVSLKSWRLHIRSRNSQMSKLTSLSIPQPRATITESGLEKGWAVLGVKHSELDGETTVDGGCSIAGMAYYVLEAWGDQAWDPRIEDDRIEGTVVVRDVFGGVARCKINFSKKPLEEVKEMIEGIEEIR